VIEATEIASLIRSSRHGAESVQLTEADVGLKPSKGWNVVTAFSR